MFSFLGGDKKKPVDVKIDHAGSLLQTYFEELQSSVERCHKKYASWAIGRELGKTLYHYTKDFLEKNQDKLSPIEKGKVLEKYIDVWRKNNCRYHINSTDYANDYVGSVFTSAKVEYDESLPMIVGFNLAQASLNHIRDSYLMFLSVNLKQADLSTAKLVASHFENCDLRGAVVYNTNLNLCYFKKCDVSKVDYTRSLLHEVYFNACNLQGSDFSHPYHLLKIEMCNIRSVLFHPQSKHELTTCFDLIDFNTFKSLCDFIETPSQNLKEENFLDGVDAVVAMLAINPSIVMSIITNHPIIPSTFLLNDLVDKMRQHGCLKKLDPLFDYCSAEEIIGSCIFNPQDLGRCIESMPDRSEILMKEIMSNEYYIKKIFEEHPEKALNQLIKKYPNHPYLKAEKLLHSHRTKRQIHNELVKLGIFQKNSRKESYRHVCSDDSRDKYHAVVRKLL